MRHSLSLAALLLIGCPAPDDGKDTDPGTDTDTGEPLIEAGTETVTTSWDVDLFDPTFESPTIARFDTMDGRRQLDSMVIAVDHTAVMTVNLENGSEFALVETDYTAELYLQSIIQLGIENADSDGEDGPPFFGPGSFQAILTKDLAAADDTEGSGPDFYSETFTDDIQFEASYDWEETPTYLDAMIGTEPIQLVVGGFSEMWVYWDNYDDGSALLYAGAASIQYSGTMTVTYTYSPTEE